MHANETEYADHFAAVLDKKAGHPLGALWVTNFAASLLMAYALYVAGGVDHSTLDEVAEKVMHAKTTRTVPAYFVHGVFCNLLVVIPYGMALFARDVKGKVLCILIPVTLFVLCGFEHCVANMFLIPFGLLVEAVPPRQWMNPLWGNLMPVTAGKVLGGVIVLFLQPRFIKMAHIQHQKYQERNS